MHGPRFTGIVFVMLVALAGYIYFIELNRPSSEAVEKVFSVQADSIEALTVRTEAGTAALQKVNGRWTLVEPESALADESIVTSITNTLASLELLRVVDEKPVDMDQYGLKHPRLEIGFKTAGQKDFEHLLIGANTHVGDDLYAKVAGGQSVVLIPGYVEDVFDRTPFSLRNKSILHLDRNTVESIELATPAGRIQLVKIDGAWRLTRPVEALADSATIEQLLDRVQTVPMISIAAREPHNLTQYGLDKPQVVLTVIGKSSRSSLAIGKLGRNGLYARDLSRPIVFEVETSLGRELSQPPETYRSRQAADGVNGAGSARPVD